MDQRIRSFEVLEPDTLPVRLGGVAPLRERVGDDPTHWRVREIGDGNVNLVFIVEGERGPAIVKQALPYFRLVGESWPLSLRRAFFEYQALLRQAARAPGMVPEALYLDEVQAFTVLEHLGQHANLRRLLIEGRQMPRVAEDLGIFMARTLFRGSDFCMDATERKADLTLFGGNVDLCAITETLVFSSPYFEAPGNRHTAPYLDGLAASLRADHELKVEAQKLKHMFATKAETLVHGDLHTGSIMATDASTKVIDPEFAFYGPMSFDVGMLLGNLWMAYFAQRGYERNGDRAAMRHYLLASIVTLWDEFRAEFGRLWRTERAGMLYQRSIFEDQGHALGAEQALNRVLHGVYEEMLGFAGVEMHRRILGLAHIVDFEQIRDPELRARCEAPALEFGRHLVVNARYLRTIEEANALAAMLDGRQHRDG
jgi:5-methylthioribose kinase